MLSLMYLGMVLLAGPVSVWLAIRAFTWTGMALAACGLIVLALPAIGMLWYWQRQRRKMWRCVFASLCAGLAGLLGAIVLSAPSGFSSPHSPVQTRFATGRSFDRYALSNIIPEAEQMNLGMRYTAYCVPDFFEPQTVDEIASHLQGLYAEMDSQDDFGRLGCVLGLAYADLPDRPTPDVGHYYLYVPGHRRSGPHPAVVFLHGSAGNFKLYTWLFSWLAEQSGCVVIAPSFGWGNWGQPEATGVVLRALEDAERIVPIDPARIYLAGFSAGGEGVTRVGIDEPQRFAGLIYLSPSLESREVRNEPFLEAWRNRPMLVVTGRKDSRIPIAEVREAIAAAREGGVQVTEVIYPEDGHCLLLLRSRDVLNNIAAWLRSLP
jgi:predicted esterase